MGKDLRRSIDTKFWTDPEVEQLSKNATYLFNALLSFPENNMAGTFEISETKMAYYTKMDNSEINEAFKELESKNKVLRFKTWVSIKNHIKNQKLNGGMAISVVKDLCDCPNPVKLWLFYQANSETLEPWFPKLLFNVNAYMNEQKKRYANRIRKDNPQITLIQALEQVRYIPLTEDKLLQIMVQNIPIDTKELSNLSNMITLIEWLDNPSMNIKNKYELEREYKKELEDIKGKGNKEMVLSNRVIEKPFSTFPDFKTNKTLTDLITSSIQIWNSFKNLPVCKYTIVNLPHVGDVKTKFDVFTEIEINGAIKNLSDYIDKESEKYKPSSFDRFIVNSLDRWLDSCKPWDRYKSDSKYDFEPDAELEEVEF